MIPADSATSKPPGSTFSKPNGHLQAKASSVVSARGKSLNCASDAFYTVLMPNSSLVSVSLEEPAQAQQVGGRSLVGALYSPCKQLQGFALLSNLPLLRGVSALSSSSLKCVSSVASSAAVASSSLVSVVLEESAQAQQVGGRSLVGAIYSPCKQLQGFALLSNLPLLRGVFALFSFAIGCVAVNSNRCEAAWRRGLCI